MNENENIDDSDNDKISFNNNELEKELLDNPSINNIYSDRDTNSINSINSEINDLNDTINKRTIKFEDTNQNTNTKSLTTNKINFINNNNTKKYRGSKYPKKKTEETYENTLLYNIDFEKTQNIIDMINENVDKVLSNVNDDMNILQRASFLNKISSVKIIVKELKNKFTKENNIVKLNNFINSKNKRGYTSLHYSIICGNFEIYNFLLKNGADRNITTNSGYNNLMLACQTKRTYVFLDEIKHQIINKQLDLNLLFNIKDKNNATLLHWAAFSDYLFGIQYLLSLNDKNNKKNNNINFINFINSRDNNNMTALQYALMNNSSKVLIDLILLEDIDLYNKDSDNRDCFEYAEAMGNEKFDEIIKTKNNRNNKLKRALYIIFFIIYNILIYFITLPIINKFFILIIQIVFNLLLIIICITIKFIINPGNPKGNKNAYNSIIYNINENNIYRELTEIIRYCPYCFSKREKTTTKHCPICDTCVDNFIIHDKFLNRCIGRNNYFFYILLKIIFIFYLLFFIIISFWSIFINLDNSEEIIFPLIKVEILYNDIAISIISFGTIFIFIWIILFKLWKLYRECRIKNINILRYSMGLDRNSRRESIM